MAGKVNFTERFSPAEATRGQFAPIDTSTLEDYAVSGSRGRYANLTYLIGSEPGALNLSLSGSTVILPVSTVNINEPLSIENHPGQDLEVSARGSFPVITDSGTVLAVSGTITTTIPDTTVYKSTSVAPTSVENILFDPVVDQVEVYNNDSLQKIYLSFESGTINTLSATALPLQSESYYTIDRTTSNVYIVNVDPSNAIDVRIIGHRKA
jgi:hypothetical protein